MKILIILITGLALTASAQLSSNLMVVNLGTSVNSTNGDTVRVGFQKTGTNILFLASAIDTNTAAIAALQSTNSQSWPSNMFSLSLATNGMGIGDFRIINSNSEPVLVEYKSNGVSIYKMAETNLIRANRVEATNFWLSSPRWVDALASGIALSPGSSSPEKADLPGAWLSTPGQGYRYGVGDYSSFSIQSWHVIATTNAAFPDLYYEPHIHVSVADLSSGTNATFVLEWKASTVNGIFTNTIIRTNTVGFTATNSHEICSFGAVTNNAFAGRSFVLFMGTVKRITSASNDVGSPASSKKVFVNSLDFHVPIRVLGSAGQYSGE